MKQIKLIDLKINVAGKIMSPIVCWLLMTFLKFRFYLEQLIHCWVEYNLETVIMQHTLVESFAL